MKDDRGKRKLPKQIQYWDTDEPGTVIVTLHYGWSFEASHEGVRGFDDTKEGRADAISSAKNAYRCECKLCKSNGEDLS